MDDFLKTRGFGQEITSDRGQDASANDVVARFQAFAAGHTPGGLAIKDLISEGRR